MQLLIIKLVCCFGWLSAIALGQLELSESISGSVGFPDLGLTCMANLAVFFWSFLRGRLYLEMGAKDTLTFLTGRIKLKKINVWDDTSNGFGWTTCKGEHLLDCSVVMLSKETPNSSMMQFMEYVANVHHVRCVLLQYFPLQSLPLVVDSICTCPFKDGCGCIVFSAPLGVTVMVAERIPGTLKRLSHSLCLLPSLDCLKNGCHGCDDGLLHVAEIDDTSYLEETDDTIKKRLISVVPLVEKTAAVHGISYSCTFKLGDAATCICIPVLQEGYDRGNDRWTELLIRCFRFNDYEIRSVIVRQGQGSISRDLENYIAQNGKCYASEEYNTAALIVPRFTEILINLVLVLWFKVDGLSSALVARRAMKQYIVDAGAREFPGHLFVNKAEVRSNDDNTNVYQWLSFRGNVWNPKALSVIVGIVNLACSITWAVLVAMEGHGNKWYHTHSMPPSKGRLLVIFVGIAIALSMDCVDLYLYLQNARLNIRGWFHRRRKHDDRRRKILIVCTMIVFQILCIVSSSVVARAVGIKPFDRWVYGAVQGLVWAKWGIGTYLIGQYVDETELTHKSTGKYMCSSAFFLNAILAGARAKWQFS